MQKKIGVTAWAVYLLLALIWGSSFILMKEGLKSFSFDQIASMRVGIAGLVLLPVALFRIRRISRRILWPALTYACLGSCIPAFLFPLGQTHLPSGVAGILNSLTPIFVLLTGILFFKAKYNWVKATGILVGFAGIIGLKLAQPQHAGGQEDFNYAWFLVLATLLYGFSNQVLARWLSQENPIVITAIAFLFLLPFVGIYLFTTPVIQVFHQDPAAWKNFSCVATLSILGTATALPLYNWLAQRNGVLFASTLTFVMPMVSLAWGLLDGEAINGMHLACMGVILAGVYLVRRKN